jgi:hypothetical protein
MRGGRSWPVGLCWAVCTVFFPEVGAAQDGAAGWTGLREWLLSVAKTDPSSVAAIEGGRVFSLAAVARMPPSNVRVTLRSDVLEGFGPGFDGGRSSESEVFINCLSRRMHTEQIQTFTENGERGVQTTGFGSSDWSRPAPGSSLDAVVSAACDPAFRGPLVAQAEISAPRPQQTVVERIAGIAAAPASRIADPSIQAQIFASRGADSADRVAAAARASVPEGLELQVVQAVVEGQRMYRVVVTGFADFAQAGAYCRQVTANAGACFARR